MTSLAFDPTKIHAHGLTYSALSRVKEPKNFYLLSPLESSHIKVDRKVLEEVKRMRPYQAWMPAQKQLQKIHDYIFIIQSLNTVSLKRHYHHILLDSSLLLSTIICLQETHIINNQPMLPNFSSTIAPTQHGLSIYYHQTTNLLNNTY